MFPTIHRFMEGLLSPRTSLRTLSEARFAQDGTGALLLERTTLFAEAQCTLGDRRLRLFCPLSPARPPARGDHGATPQISSGRIPAPVADAARGIHLHRRYRHAAHLRPGRAGTSRRGRAARNGVGHATRDRLLSALDTLQRQLAQAGLTHNNLKAANLWMTPDYRLLPLRYAYMRFDGRATTHRSSTRCALSSPKRPPWHK